MSNETKIIWFTGLSGSGKSTIVNVLVEDLKEKNKTFKIFDGDDVREKLHKHLGFTHEDIKKNNKLIVELCKEELGNVDIILVPIISPFIESRTNARKEFKKNFIEVFINCSYEECKKRDVKGLYKKAESGEVKNFIGLHVKYEPPTNPEISIDTTKDTPQESSRKIIDFLNLN